VCTNLKLLGDIDVSDVEILTVGHPASLMYQKFSRILTLALVLSIGYNVARALFETDASGLDGHGNRQKSKILMGTSDLASTSTSFSQELGESKPFQD
jgi:hypothetical protein